MSVDWRRQEGGAAAAEAAGSHLVTVLKAPLGRNDSDVPKFLKESSRHVHSVRRGGVQVLYLSYNFPDFPGQLVVQRVVFSLLDAIPPHDLHLMEVVANLPVDEVHFPQQLLLMELQLSHHFQEIELV